MRQQRLTILVAGMISAVPRQGGWTWVILQYVLGLQQLGHEVYFVETIPRKALSPEGAALAASANAAYFREVVAEFGLERCASLLLQDSYESVGLPYDEIAAAARRSLVLLNISGALADDSLATGIPIRAYVDLDPCFTQLWQEQHIDMRFGDSTHYLTVGLAIGSSSCDIPTCGCEWIPTLQPIVLKEWPAAAEAPAYGLTTIANWRGYGSIEHDGVFYGQKAHSLRQLIDLPRRTPEEFTLALSIHPDETRDVAALESNGWHILDPPCVASTPSQYRNFVQRSKGEFGVAKSGYVTSQCGWFSDRSICYLASGRPVIAQETGFSCFLPLGEGLFGFQTKEEVVAAIELLNSNYARHCRAAREIAMDYFDSDKVLTCLLRNVGAI